MANGREKFRLAWRWSKSAAFAIAIIGILAIGSVFVPQVEAQQRDKTQEAESEATDPQAYDAFLKGWALLQRGGADRSAAAIPYFEQAIALDPEYGRAYAALALTYQSAIEQVWWQRFGLTYGEAEDKTEEYLALALERPTALAYRVSAQMHLGLGDADAAAAESKRAIELEPNNADGYLALAQVLVPKGEHEEALDAVTKAKRLDPQNPQIYDRWGGQAQFHLGRFEDAAVTLRQVVELDPEDLWSHMWLGVAYAELGREDEGWEEIVRLNAMRKERSGSAPISLKIVTAFDFDRAEDAQRLRQSLRLIGVTIAATPPIRPRDRLKGEELRAFSRMPWWYGGEPGGATEFWIFFNSPGELIYDWLMMGGVGRSLGIENDQICNEYAGAKRCVLIYRNPEGTRENNDEYILASAGHTIFFSAYEERPPALKDRPNYWAR